MEANVLGYDCFHRVGEAGVSSWAGGGEKWREAFGGIKFGAAMVRMCVKEASVQISTGLT